MRIAARVDNNQTMIVRALRKLGMQVVCTHQIGSGFPDLCCSYNFKTKLAEIKDGLKPESQQKLTKDQILFHSLWKDKIFIIKNIEDAYSFYNSFL